jgi:quercetin dioxygenase-like cupin family protein
LLAQRYKQFTMIPFHTIEWTSVPESKHNGESGHAIWRTLQYGGVRVRLVTYSANYKSDHWCSKGHIIHCLDGEMVTELKDGRKYILKSGMSYITSDDEVNPHRSASEKGCQLLIVDGTFLNPDAEKI